MVAFWSTFAISGPCVPKSSVVGATVLTLQAFWIVICTGMVLVACACALPMARPSAARERVATYLMFMVGVASMLDGVRDRTDRRVGLRPAMRHEQAACQPAIRAPRVCRIIVASQCDGARSEERRVGKEDRW